MSGTGGPSVPSHSRRARASTSSKSSGERPGTFLGRRTAPFSSPSCSVLLLLLLWTGDEGGHPPPVPQAMILWEATNGQEKGAVKTKLPVDPAFSSCECACARACVCVYIKQRQRHTTDPCNLDRTKKGLQRDTTPKKEEKSQGRDNTCACERGKLSEGQTYARIYSRVEFNY